MSPDFSDEQLMQSFCDGDSKAFDTLYDRHRGGLYRYVVRLCGENRGNKDNENLFQDCWLRIIEKRQQWDSKQALKPWLYRIAHNLVIDHLRREGRFEDDQELNPDDHSGNHKDLSIVAMLQDCVERLKALLGQLPQSQRDVFLLKEEGGLTLAEIGEINDIGRETVKSRLRYANQRLKQGLEGCE